MPNSPRRDIKLKLDSLVSHIGYIQSQLVLLGEIYREFHPDYTERYEITYAYAEQLKIIIEQLRETV